MNQLETEFLLPVTITRTPKSVYRRISRYRSREGSESPSFPILGGRGRRQGRQVGPYAFFPMSRGQENQITLTYAQNPRTANKRPYGVDQRSGESPAVGRMHLRTRNRRCGIMAANYKNTPTRRCF